MQHRVGDFLFQLRSTAEDVRSPGHDNRQ